MFQTRSADPPPALFVLLGFACAHYSLPAMSQRFDRALMMRVLVYHQRMEDPPKAGGCSCGWWVLGHSWAGHVVEVYEMSVDVLSVDNR
jgi:hypothetical protein